MSIARCLAGLMLFGLVSVTWAQQTEIQYLSGHGKDDAVPWKFFCTSGANSGFWTNLPVPSQWDFHGFGSLHYHKDPPSAYNEKGIYKHDFNVPAKWSGRRIFLVFEGVMTDTKAKWNGHSVGPMHQGGFYQFKYEVTPWVRFGSTNHLEVTVAKHSANASVNRAERDADYWVFGGIYRPVYIQAVPPQFIERVAINALASGKFLADVYVNNATNADEVEAQIQTLDGRSVGRLFKTDFTPGTGVKQVQLATQIHSPKLWSAETPNLYQVEFRLLQNGKVIHQVTQRFGFRTFEVRDGKGLYLNGKRIILKGCDRHSLWPTSGRCLSDAVQLLDIRTMKAMNMNAVRMSHYPPDADFLDRCDQLGLYVLDELAGWHHAYDTKIGKKLVREMVTRDVNHPCVLFWDNGNEGGFNTNLDKVFDQYDPQHRRVLHPWAPFDGLNTAHYLPYSYVKLACQGIPIIFHKDRYIAFTNSPKKFIYMPTEFEHGLYDGGAGAGLADIWALMKSSPYLGGGFIWAFLDQGIIRPDTGKMDVAGNRGPDGIVGPFRQREASFYAIKQIWSPLVVLQTNLPAGFNGRLTLVNHYSFINTRQCHFIWQLRRFNNPTTSQPVTIIAAGTAPSPDIAPGKRGQLRLNLPANWRQLAAASHAGALSLRIANPKGRELWTYVWPLRTLAQSPIFKIMPACSVAEASVPPKIVKDATNLEVFAGMLTVSFDRQSGYLKDVKWGSQRFSLGDGPRPAVGQTRLEHLQTKLLRHEAEVTATYQGSLRRVAWRIGTDGRLACNYTYNARGTNSYFGVLFNYPEKLVKAKRWLGDGPYRVWKNRLAGATFGYWHNPYNNTITGWHDWVYPEFKGCFANVRWLQLKTDEGWITIEPHHVPYVQVLTPEFPPAKLAGHTIPSVPKCGLGLLNAIPPIGSKFQASNVVSPSGDLPVAHGQYQGSVVFYFGKSIP